MTSNRPVFTPEHEEFRSLVKEFLAREVAPHHEAWERNGQVDPSVHKAAAERGLLGFSLPTDDGVLGLDELRPNAIQDEDLAETGMGGPALHPPHDHPTPH